MPWRGAIRPCTTYSSDGYPREENGKKKEKGPETTHLPIEHVVRIDAVEPLLVIRLAEYELGGVLDLILREGEAEILVKARRRRMSDRRGRRRRRRRGTRRRERTCRRDEERCR